MKDDSDTPEAPSDDPYDHFHTLLPRMMENWLSAWADTWGSESLSNDSGEASHQDEGDADFAEDFSMKLTEDELLAEVTEDVYAAVEGSLHLAALRAMQQRSSIEAQLEKVTFHQLTPLTMMLGWCHASRQALLNDLSDQVSTGDRDRVVAAYGILTARALGAAEEIEALLRNGLRHAALARWRLLYELAVISGVLLEGNRYICARYVNYEYVLMSRWPAEFFEDAEGLRELRRVQQKAKQFIRRYGPDYARPYGWAANLCKRRLGVHKPNLYHLEKLAPQIKTYRYYKHLANHSIHADSLGATLLREESGSLHVGRSTLHLPHLAAAAINMLSAVFSNGARLLARYDLVEHSTALALEFLAQEAGLSSTISTLREDVWGEPEDTPLRGGQTPGE